MSTHTDQLTPGQQASLLAPAMHRASPLAGCRIAFIRFDVLTRGADTMADILTDNLRHHGATVTIFHARGRFSTRFPIDKTHYTPLRRRLSPAVLLEIALNHWSDHDLLMSDFVPLLYALGLRHRRRLLYFAQNYDVVYYRSRLKRWFMRRLYRKTLQEWRIPLLCTSRQLARVFSDSLGVSPVVIRQGDRTRLLSFRRYIGVRASPPRARRFVVMSIVGRTHAKGLDLLRKALMALDREVGDDLEIWLAGAQFHCRFTRASHHHFGLCAPDVLASLYCGADVFLFPSRFENYPSPPFEAMLCDCPVVSTPVAEYLEDRSNALLVPVEDAIAMARSAIEILDSEDLAHALIRGGKRTVEKTERELCQLPDISEDFLQCARPLLP